MLMTCRRSSGLVIVPIVDSTSLDFWIGARLDWSLAKNEDQSTLEGTQMMDESETNYRSGDVVTYLPRLDIGVIDNSLPS